MTNLNTQGIKAKEAASFLRTASSQDKVQALRLIAASILDHKEEIIKANDLDVKAAASTMSPSKIDRLKLDSDRINAMAEAVINVSKWPDPIGRITEKRTLPNGIKLSKSVVPLGVVGIIFEARPNVTSDCAALCIAAGNSCILRGGKEAFNSNKAIVSAMQKALSDSALPKLCVQLVEDTSRNSAMEMMEMTKYLDVLIPRGGAALIRNVVENAKVPVIETGSGNCHIYVDKDANLDMATSIVFNAKTSRPSVCNAAEKLLIHKDIARTALPKLRYKLMEMKVELLADEKARIIDPSLKEAHEDDWGTEYLDYIMAIKIVDSIDEAISHIEKYSTHHSECIITENEEAAERFLQNVDSAAVYHNASTRFTDGGEMGLGAEIGISTQKLHARGPMGVDQLTSYKYIMRGNGQIR